MGIGLGGGLGPFRAGVSTRGAGVGCGPLSAGSGCAGTGGILLAYFGFIAAVSVVLFAVAWPWLLGALVAQLFGAEDPSWERSVVGWAFELCGIAVAIPLTVAIWRRIAGRILRASNETNLQRLKAQSDELRAVAAAVVENGEATRADPLLVVPRVFLMAPRVQVRGESAVLVQIDTGDLVFTHKSMRFVGSTKSAEWIFARLVHVSIESDFIKVVVSNRQTVMGVGSQTGSTAALEVALDWAGGTSSADDVLSRLRALLKENSAAQKELLHALDR